MSDIELEMVRSGKLYVGERSVTRMTRDRYHIYLPKMMNPIWRRLEGRKVKVWIEIPPS